MPLLNEAEAIRLGTTEVDAVYLGSDQVWPAAWTPASIPGLAAWFDATQDTFVDGQAITTYVEHSPTGRVFNAANVGAEPKFRTGEGRPYIEMWTAGGGSGGFIGAALWNPGTVGLTFIYLCHITGGSYPMMLVWGPDANGFEMRHDGSALQAVLMYSSYGIYFSHPTATGGGVDHVYMLRVKAGNPTDMWSDGIKHTDSRGPAAMPNINDTLWIGRRQGGYNFIGRMYEALVYAGSISDADRTLIADYLQAKWFTPPYVTRVLSLNPLSFWRLGEPSGIVAVDETGFANGTYTVAPTLGVPGLVAGSTAMQTAGVQNQGMSAYNPPEYRRESVTVEAWIKTSNPGAAYRSIVVKQNSYGLFTNNGSLTVYVWGTGQNVDTGANIADGLRHHVVAAFSPNALGSQVYLDGVAVGSPFTYATLSDAGNLDVGYNDYAGQEWNGIIDEVAIYPRTLSAAEVAGNYAAGS